MNRRLMDNRRMAVLRDDITHTRADLGETVQALTDRLDVRSRARASAQRMADRMSSTGRRSGPWLLLPLGVIGLVIAGVVARRRARTKSEPPDPWERS